jgi:membrane protein implicated in regulation of membrane protease activity
VDLKAGTRFYPAHQHIHQEGVMRGIIAGLLVAALLVAVALVIAAVGSLGVAAIGLMLHRLFDLTQWQATLIALAVGASLSYVVYRVVAAASEPSTFGNGWGKEADEEEEEEEEEAEPPIVPWRRSRPTPGQLPPEKPASTRGKPAGKKR